MAWDATHSHRTRCEMIHRTLLRGRLIAHQEWCIKRTKNRALGGEKHTPRMFPRARRIHNVCYKSSVRFYVRVPSIYWGAGKRIHVTQRTFLRARPTMFEPVFQKSSARFFVRWRWTTQ